MRPEFTVVIPCYNQGRFLPEAVESVRNQAGVCVEIIVVDDGSSDAATAAFVRGPHQPGLRVLAQSNQGVSAARNAGIRAASAPLVAVLDADDKLAPGFLAAAKSVLESRPDITLVGGKTEFFGNRWGPANFAPFDWPRMLYDNCVAASVAFRRCDWEKTGGYCPAMPYGEDWDFHLSLLELGDYHELPFVTLHYRRHGGNVTSEYNRDAAKRDAMYALLVSRHPALFARHAPALVRALAAERYKHQAIMRHPLVALVRKGLKLVRRWPY